MLTTLECVLFSIMMMVMTGDVGGRETPRLVRSLPSITNSLVNLGKMDIAFYINGKPNDLKVNQENSNLSPTSDYVVEPCPCSGLKYFRDTSRGHPVEILSKLLQNNDPFFQREPTVSTLCCDSHEQVQENSVVLEFGPKQQQMVAGPLKSGHFPIPLLLDTFVSGKPTQPLSPAKQKIIELFVFPKKKEQYSGKIINDNRIDKDGIKIVGDKEVRNDFKTMKFLPLQSRLPHPPSSSVKKDLTIQESKTKQDLHEKSISNSNIV
ncbi:unnamed protein product [Leptosia nina]|uniref:Uncharacterized protein n=1 Tax=Leptosia nina TaxID=320188 RepID=A0AAV1JWD3_9NEOP